MALIHGNSMDWASLPFHLLDAIFADLVELSDLIRFATVCKPWFSVAIHNKKMVFSRKQLPMLMVSLGDKNNSQRRSLYNIIKNRHYNFELNLCYVKRCCGSSHGWLATVEKDYAITLINPFVIGSNSIRLPPIIDKSENRDYNNYEYDVNKVILSANPLECENYVVVAIPQYCNLAFIKAGDSKWTYIDIVRGLLDVIYYQDKFYAVNQPGEVIVSLNLSDGLPTIDVQVIHVEPMVKWEETASRSYLVESCAGDLLLVQRCLVGDVTSDFKVGKLKYSSEDCCHAICIQLDSLGDQTLFLGDNHSFSIVASKFSGLHPNSIYYTDDIYSTILYHPFGPRDMGVFNLENKSFKLHYVPDPSNKKLSPPIWIMPTLQGKLATTIEEEHKNLSQESIIMYK